MNQCFRIVNHSKNVTLSFDKASRQYGEVFRGSHKGKVFVTTHRMVFLSDDQRDNLLSFAIAFMYIKDLRVEQPIFGANYIEGIAGSHPNGERFSFISEEKKRKNVSHPIVDGIRKEKEVDKVEHDIDEENLDYIDDIHEEMVGVVVVDIEKVVWVCNDDDGDDENVDHYHPLALHSRDDDLFEVFSLLIFFSLLLLVFVEFLLLIHMQTNR